MNNLQPCKTCGNEHVDLQYKNGVWFVLCRLFGCRNKGCKTEAEAISNWNTRPDLSPQTAPADDVRQRVRIIEEARELQKHQSKDDAWFWESIINLATPEPPRTPGVDVEGLKREVCLDICAGYCPERPGPLQSAICQAIDYLAAHGHLNTKERE